MSGMMSVFAREASWGRLEPCGRVGCARRVMPPPEPLRRCGRTRARRRRRSEYGRGRTSKRRGRTSPGGAPHPPPSLAILRKGPVNVTKLHQTQRRSSSTVPRPTARAPFGRGARATGSRPDYRHVARTPVNASRLSRSPGTASVEPGERARLAGGSAPTGGLSAAAGRWRDRAAGARPGRCRGSRTGAGASRRGHRRSRRRCGPCPSCPR